MQRFVFSLERLLELRTAQLDAENARLQALYSERAAIDAACRDLKESDRNAVRDVLAPGTVNGLELESLARYHEHVRRRLAGLAERGRDCEQRIEKQRGQVLALDRAKQLLERMKQKQWEEWKYEANKEIESTAGELYLAGWNRRARER